MEDNKVIKNKVEATRMDPLVIESVCKVLSYGANKYGLNNYQTSVNINDYTNALQRHFNAFLLGDELDKDTGESHMSHIIANAMMIMVNRKSGNFKMEDLYNIKR